MTTQHPGREYLSMQSGADPGGGPVNAATVGHPIKYTRIQSKAALGGGPVIAATVGKVVEEAGPRAAVSPSLLARTTALRRQGRPAPTQDTNLHFVCD